MKWLTLPKTVHPMLIICLSIFAGLFLTIHLLFPTANPYDYYTRLSAAFLSKKLCLQDNPTWLNELIPIDHVGYCVVYPIAPALLLLPFVAILPSFTQTMGAHLIYALGGVVVFLWCRKRRLSQSVSLFYAFTWSFATIFFPMSSVGSAWYIAQTIGAVFLLLTLFIFDEKKKSSLLVSGFLLSIAATARLPLHLCVFYFVVRMLLHYKKHWKKTLICLTLFGIGFSPLFLVQRAYNYLRYGTVSDAGYYLIPGKFNEADFQNGEFNLVNIPKHLNVLFFELPRRTDAFPYLVPSYLGLSILITSPFLVFACVGLLKQKMYPEIAIIVLILLLEMSHGTVGFAQFGYRFALDVYPFLFLGLSSNQLNSKQKYIFVALVLFSMLVNLWGAFAFRNNWFIW